MGETISRPILAGDLWPTICGRRFPADGHGADDFRPRLRGRRFSPDDYGADGSRPVEGRTAAFQCSEKSVECDLWGQGVKRFQFDRVYDGSVTDEAFYESECQGLTRSRGRRTFVCSGAAGSFTTRFLDGCDGGVEASLVEVRREEHTCGQRHHWRRGKISPWQLALGKMTSTRGRNSLHV